MLSEQKKKQAQKMIQKFLKDHKDEEQEKIKIGFLSEDEKLGKIEKLPTGLIALDTLTNGGLAKGHVNLIYGGESAGKTTTFFEIIKHCQRTLTDFLPGYVSAEKSLDRIYATAVGVDANEVVIMEGETAENNTDFCIQAADPENGYNLLIVDTLQALASKQELYKGSTETVRSTEDNSMALLPRVYSQFFRMYTSRSIGQLTLLFGSQVRTDLSNPMFARDKQTGGNALKHYNLITIQMRRAGDSEWPTGKDGVPPNSFVVVLSLDKAKIPNRYRGNKINMYFKEGKFEHKFNVVALAKDIGLHDGKTLKYEVDEPLADSASETKEVEFKARGFNDFYNRIPDEAVEWLEKRINEAYTKQVMSYEGDVNEDQPENAD